MDSTPSVVPHEAVGADRLERAIDRFDRLMADRSDQPGPRFSKAVALASARLHGRATDAFGQLLESEESPPFQELTRLARARSLRAGGDFAEALDVLMGVAPRLPETVSVDIEIALNLVALGRLGEARTRTQTAIDRHTTAAAHIVLILCLCSVLKAMEQPEAGIQLCQDALADTRLPRPGLWARRADFLISMGRWAEAEQDLERALDAEPAIAGAQANRGLLYLIADERALAQERLNLAVSLDPGLREICEVWWHHGGHTEAMSP